MATPTPRSTNRFFIRGFSCYWGISSESEHISRTIDNFGTIHPVLGEKLRGSESYDETNTLIPMARLVLRSCRSPTLCSRVTPRARSKRAVARVFGRLL
jgi:hypothetical protein